MAYAVGRNGDLPAGVYDVGQPGAAAMGDTVERQYTAEIVEFDNPGKTIDYKPISASTSDDAIAQARGWASERTQQARY